MVRIKLRLLFVILLLLGLTALYFEEPLFSGKVLAYRDLWRHTYPLRSFTVSCMKAGRVPLWNPYIFCGTPHLAAQQGAVFYPLSVIYYLFPLASAFNSFLVLHVFLAGLFTFLLCRRWGLGLSSSIISSVTFMFSGYVASLLNLATTLGSVIWFPAILLSFDKAMAEKNTRWLMIASFFLAVMFLGGEPSIFYSTSWVLLFYTVFFWMNNRQHLSFAKTAALYLAVVTTAALLTSIQLVGFLEFLRLSDRVVRNEYGHLTLWSLHLKDTMDFFLPFFARTDFSKEAYWYQQNWVYIIYIGVLAVLLPLFAVSLRWKDWRVRYLCYIGALFLLISYGGHTPFYYLVYKFIPGFRYIRYPVRFLYITTFAIAMLCGFGFDAYIKERENNKKALVRLFRPVLYILFFFSVVLLFLHLYFYEILQAIFNYCSSHNLTKSTPLAYAFMYDIKNIGRFIGFFLVAGIILFLGSRFKVRQGFIGFAIASLVIADFLSSAPPERFLVDRKIFSDKTPNIEYLQKDESYFRFFVSPKTSVEKSFISGSTYQEALCDSKDTLSANYPMLFGLYDAGGYDSLKVGVHTKFIQLVGGQSPAEIKLLNALNVKYVIVGKELDAEGYKLVRHGRVYIYENTNALPRAFLVGSFKVLKRPEDIANRLKSKDFDPAKEVILEEEPGHLRGVTSQSNHSPEVVTRQVETLNYPEKVNITKYAPNEVVIKAAVNSPKFLVLSDTYYPGWKAYVDGKREKIYKADYMLRAVRLREGEHTIKFVFDPFSFKLGAALSIITLIFIAAYIAIIKK